jgi:CxxC motif-containing protein
MGCSLNVDEDANGELIVSGNKCQRGPVYAQEEIRAPKRVVTATCKVTQSTNVDANQLGTHRRIPVKSNVPCPKEKIDDLLKDIYHTSVKLPVNAGDVIISNWNESGIDVLAIRSMQ